MNSKSILVFIIGILCLPGCHVKHSDSNETSQGLVKEYISYAENQDTPIQRRLFYAHYSDSVINLHHPIDRGQTLRVLALTYLDAGDVDKAQHYFKNTVSHAQKYEDDKLQGLALNNIGAIYHRQTQYDSAIKYYNAALKMFDSNAAINKAMTLVNVGIIYKEQGQYDFALRNVLSGATILDSIGEHSNLATAYNSAGNIFNEINSFDKAIWYHRKALDIRKAIKDTIGIAGSLNNIGNTYKRQKKHKEALDYYTKSLEQKRKIGDLASAAITINNIAEVYYALDDYKQAERYYLEALDIRTRRNDIDGIMTSANGLTELYLAANDLAKAKSFAMFTLEKGKGSGNGLLRHRLRNYLQLVQIYKAEGKNPIALNYAMHAHILKDSIFSEDMASTIAEMEARYRTKEQEVQLLRSKKKQVLQTKKLARQEVYIASLLVITVLLIIVIYLIYRLSRQRKRAKERNETLLHELNHRVKNNLQIITGIIQLQIAGTNDQHQTNALQSILNRIHSINSIHKLLLETGYSQRINIKLFTTDLVGQLLNVHKDQAQQYDVTTNLDDFTLHINQTIPFGLIVNELLTNAFKHTNISADNVQLNIRLSSNDNIVSLIISTYPSSWTVHGGSIHRNTGLFLIDILVRQLKGKFTNENENSTLTQSLVFKAIK